MRADQIYKSEGKNGMYWFAPIVADAEAGFGGNTDAFELMKAMIGRCSDASILRISSHLLKVRSTLAGRCLVPESNPEASSGTLAADVMGDANSHHGEDRRRQRSLALA
jgi:isocitrate lyase